jgi:hypothetical protein
MRCSVPKELVAVVVEEEAVVVVVEEVRTGIVTAIVPTKSK